MPICASCRKEVKRAKLCSICGSVFEEYVKPKREINLDPPINDQLPYIPKKYQGGETTDRVFDLALVLMILNILPIYLLFTSGLIPFIGFLFWLLCIIQVLLTYGLFIRRKLARNLQSIVSLLIMTGCAVIILQETQFSWLIWFVQNAIILYVLFFRPKSQFQF